MEQVEQGILKDLTRRILGCAIEVHKVLGPGLLESTYQACFLRELELQGLCAEAEVHIPINYKGLDVPSAYRADVIVEGSVLIELKAVEEIDRCHTAQLLTYLRHSVLPVGLLINFNEPTLMSGVRRYARTLPYKEKV